MNARRRLPPTFISSLKRRETRELSIASLLYTLKTRCRSIIIIISISYIRVAAVRLDLTAVTSGIVVKDNGEEKGRRRSRRQESWRKHLVLKFVFICIINSSSLFVGEEVEGGGERERGGGSLLRFCSTVICCLSLSFLLSFTILFRNYFFKTTFKNNFLILFRVYYSFKFPFRNDKSDCLFRVLLHFSNSTTFPFLNLFNMSNVIFYLL